MVMAFECKWGECIQVQAGVQAQVRPPVAQRQHKKIMMTGMKVVMKGVTLAVVGVQMTTLGQWAAAAGCSQKFWM